MAEIELSPASAATTKSRSSRPGWSAPMRTLAVSIALLSATFPFWIHPVYRALRGRELAGLCQDDDDCKSGACAFGPMSLGFGICARACKSTGDCPAGFSCIQAGGRPLCLRLGSYLISRGGHFHTSFIPDRELGRCFAVTDKDQDCVP
jgi:hypothetical protein